EPQAAGALHVLHHDRRVARDVLAQVPSDGPRIEVVAAADAVADVEVEGTAFVEVPRALGTGDRYRHHGHEDRRETARSWRSCHKASPGHIHATCTPPAAAAAAYATTHPPRKVRPHGGAATGGAA